MFALKILIFDFAWWFGLYLLARNPARPLLRRAGFGLVAYALALAAGLLGEAAPLITAAVLARVERLLLLVPAERYLYGTFDRALGHYRRYERRPLHGLLVRSGFTVEKLRYMNVPGILGWFVNGRLLRRELLPKRQLALFNVLAPLFERIEAALPPPRGQSLVAICRKP